MSPLDDFDDPLFGTPPDRGDSFWSSVEWRARLGIVLCVLTGVIVYFVSEANARRPEDVPLQTAGCVIGLGILWIFSRAVYAWVEWPSTNPLLRGLKGVIRYLGFDSASERRAAGGTLDEKRMEEEPWLRE